MKHSASRIGLELMLGLALILSGYKVMTHDSAEKMREAYKITVIKENPEENQEFLNNYTEVCKKDKYNSYAGQLLIISGGIVSFFALKGTGYSLISSKKREKI